MTTDRIFGFLLLLAACVLSLLALGTALWWLAYGHRRLPTIIAAGIFVLSIVAIRVALALIFFGSWWSTEITENASASLWVCASATRYGSAEDVRVVPVVVSPLKLGNIQWQIVA